MKTKQSTRTTIQESDDGVMFRAKEIPGCLFNFYVLRTNRQYKDGTYCWNVCAEYTANPKYRLPEHRFRVTVSGNYDKVVTYGFFSR